MSAKATGRMGYAARVTRRTVTVTNTDTADAQVKCFRELSHEGDSFISYLKETFWEAGLWLKAQGFDPDSGLRNSKRRNARRVDLSADEVPPEFKRHRALYLFCRYAAPVVGVPLKGIQELPHSGTLWIAQQSYMAGRLWQTVQDILHLSPPERDVGEDFRALVGEITRRRAAGEKVASSQWFAIMQKIQAGAGRTKLMTQTQFTNNLHKYRRKPGFGILKSRK